MAGNVAQPAQAAPLNPGIAALQHGIPSGESFPAREQEPAPVQIGPRPMTHAPGGDDAVGDISAADVTRMRFLGEALFASFIDLNPQSGAAQVATACCALSLMAPGKAL